MSVLNRGHWKRTNQHKGFRMKELIVYGAGLFGPSVCEAMQAQKCFVSCVVDRAKTGKIHKTPIVPPAELERMNLSALPIYLTLVNPDHEIEVLDYLRSLKSRPTIKSFHDILFEFPDFVAQKRKQGFAWLADGCFNAAHAGCENLFSDAKSRWIAKQWMKFRETWDPKYYVQPEGSQYVPVDLNWIETFSGTDVTFLDVGAYTGDSSEFFIKKFLEIGKNLRDYFALEVDPRNFIALSANLRIIAEKYPGMRLIALPIGAWSEHRLIPLNSDGSSSQLLIKETKVAASMIPVAKLDDIFFAVSPDVIKMDIEGSEREAIAGAQNIIREHTPVLLISLYHRPEDLWEIPALIKTICPDYDLSIRVHAHLFLETVLYALPKKRAIK